MTNESISRFRNIMDDLRKLPDTSDEITAYGCYGGLVDMDVLGDFAEAIWTDEEFIRRERVVKIQHSSRFAVIKMIVNRFLWCKN